MARNFQSEITINKIFILKKELDYLIKESYKLEKAFNELCDSMDNNSRDANEASSILTVILDKSDAIYQKLNKIKVVMNDLKSELSN